MSVTFLVTSCFARIKNVIQFTFLIYYSFFFLKETSSKGYTLPNINNRIKTIRYTIIYIIKKKNKKARL